MNVRRLIQLLQTLPPEARVCGEDEGEIGRAELNKPDADYPQGYVVLTPYNYGEPILP